MFCYIPKVACTNFKRIFLGLKGIIQPSEVHNESGYNVHFTFKNRLTFLKDYRKEGRNMRLKEYKKIIFVRDPLERLVSAYRSKLEIHPNPDARAVFLNIIRLFYVDFPERKRERNIGETEGKNIDITFRDFLYFILDHLELRGQVNEHFVPMVNLCDPCNVNYDFIGSFNNLKEEAEYVFKEFSINYQYPTRNDNYSAVDTSEIVDQYYKELPPSLMQSVWELFKKDYFVFDLPVPKWLIKYSSEHNVILNSLDELTKVNDTRSASF